MASPATAGRRTQLRSPPPLRTPAASDRPISRGRARKQAPSLLGAVVRAISVAIVVGAALAFGGAATHHCPHGVRAALDEHRRRLRARGAPPAAARAAVDGAASLEDSYTSGDLIFLAFDGTMAPAWAPTFVKQIKNQVPMHVALVMQHPQHGLVLVDACFDGRHPTGSLIPPNGFSRAAPNVLREDGATVNGSFRATRLADALLAFRGCAWVRHLRTGVTVDADAVWAALFRLNAAVPTMTQGNTNGRNARVSGLAGRLASWVARSMREGLQAVTDGWISDGGARHLSCIHSLMLLLEAGGLWAHAPHRLDREARVVAGLDTTPARVAAGARALHAFRVAKGIAAADADAAPTSLQEADVVHAAEARAVEMAAEVSAEAARRAGSALSPRIPASRARYERNLAAIEDGYAREVRTRTCMRAAPLGAPSVAPIHAMAVDVSSDSADDAAALFWGVEIYLPSDKCDLARF